MRELGDALRAEGVGYCHFKSNAFLDRSLNGTNDLDLLVARADAARFAAVLYRLSFKLALRATNALPGVLDYYGLDEASARLVHVHAHFQLIVGDDLTKNYRLPLERPFLSAAVDGALPVPPPELELILLVIRLALKHLTWDARVALRGSLSASAQAELEYLEARADPARLRASLADWLPAVSEATFQRCRGALTPGVSAIAGARAGEELLRALRPFARRPRSLDVALKLERRGVEIARAKLNRPAAGKRLAAGGAFVALIGADGAGKSTAIDALDKFLRTFAVTRVHLGRPPQSAARRTLTGLALGRGALRRLAGRPGRSRSTQQAVLLTALARDRYRAYRRARGIATSGGIVISDRFPLPQLASMDAPRVERFSDPRRFQRLVRRLAAVEARYYEAIVDPDALIVLRVDPDVAVARKPEEDPEFVRARWQEVWAVDWSTVGAHVVDAGAPVEEVHAAVRSLVWRTL